MCLMPCKKAASPARKSNHPFQLLRPVPHSGPGRFAHQGLSEFVIPCSVLAPALGVSVPIEVKSIRKLVAEGH
jgi:hypothetical protein